MESVRRGAALLVLVQSAWLLWGAFSAWAWGLDDRLVDRHGDEYSDMSVIVLLVLPSGIHATWYALAALALWRTGLARSRLRSVGKHGLRWGVILGEIIGNGALIWILIGLDSIIWTYPSFLAIRVANSAAAVVVVVVCLLVELGPLMDQPATERRDGVAAG